MSGDGPSSYDRPQVLVVGQTVTSVERVPLVAEHVHHALVAEAATAAAFDAFAQPPGLFTGIAGT